MIKKQRFQFGKNWQNFLQSMNDARINEAIISIKNNLALNTLEGKTFLDIGCGSGLFSLAAHKLGAKQIYSFDYDENSVQATKFLHAQYANESQNWQIEQGSVLDAEYLQKYGQVDYLYSWGVLHHTGDMALAFANVAKMVKPDGKLFISIYNDQGVESKIWHGLKRFYCQGGAANKFFVVLYTFFRCWTKRMIYDLFTKCNPLYTWNHYGDNNRGMSAWHDLIDWAGGYPFEYAKPEQIFEFFKNQGFALEKLKTCRGGLGCNEFVFRKL